MHFHRDVLAVADTFSARVLKPTPDDIFAGSPPLAFTFGLGALLIFPIRAGASTLLIERATPAELADHIAHRGVSVVSTAATSGLPTPTKVSRNAKASLGPPGAWGC
jgi:2-aminobenzoate-CoA ligase